MSTKGTRGESRLNGVAPARLKHEQVEAALLAHIASGDARRGATLPSEAQIMRDFQVSRNTVRRAIRGLVRQGVLTSLAGYGHVVRSNGVRPVIGVLYGHAMFSPELVPSYHLQIEAIRRELVQRNCTMWFYATRLGQGEHERDRQQLQRDVRRGLLTGLVALSWPDCERDGRAIVRRDLELMKLFESVKLPYTAISSLAVPAAVAADYGAAGYLGARHFLEQGIRDVALMTYEVPNTLFPKHTIDGYRKALAEFGVPFQERYLLRAGPEPESSGYYGFKQWWPKSGEPSALVVDDDTLCKGMMIAAMEMGIDIPRRLPIAALAIKGSRTFFPRPYVRLEHDPEKIAHELVNRLLGMIERPGVVPPPLLIAPSVIPT
ncbi:MAG: GntR family transcriptional regulator [Kiritimatiellae bacterium]|nr:GntR family transcriptional regulator [Kiritimatiellia bacterium]